MYGHWESGTRKLNRHYQSCSPGIGYGHYWNRDPVYNYDSIGNESDIIINNTNEFDIYKISDKINMVYNYTDNSTFLTGRVKQRNANNYMKVGNDRIFGYQITLLTFKNTGDYYNFILNKYLKESALIDGKYEISINSTFLKVINGNERNSTLRGWYYDNLSNDSIFRKWIEISNHNISQEKNNFNTWPFYKRLTPIYVPPMATSTFRHTIDLTSNKINSSIQLFGDMRAISLQDIGKTIIVTSQPDTTAKEYTYVYVITATIYDNNGNIVKL